MSIVSRVYDAKLDVEEGERAVVATISTGMLDRYRTVIVPKGAMLDNYRKNPVVMLNHGRGNDGLPIGKNVWIKVYKDKLVAKTIFMDADLNETADQVFRMFQKGYMTSFSISFDPKDYGKPTPEEVKKNPDLAEAMEIYRTWDLLEYSAVGIPANPEAVAEAVSRGLKVGDWFDRSKLPAVKPPEPQAPALPPLKGRRLADVEAALVRQVREMAGSMTQRAIKDTLDLRRGRI